MAWIVNTGRSKLELFSNIAKTMRDTVRFDFMVGRDYQKIPQRSKEATVWELVSLTYNVIKNNQVFFLAINFIWISFYLLLLLGDVIQRYLAIFLVAQVVFYWVFSSQIVSLNRWLKSRNDTTITVSQEVPFLVKPEWVHFKFFFAWILLFWLLNFTRELRYPEQFELPEFVGTFAKLAYFVIWFLMFRAYLALPAVALKEPIAYAWKLGNNRYVEIFISSIIVSLPFLLFAFCFGFVLFQTTQNIELLSSVVQFWIQLAALIHFSVLYDYYQQQGLKDVD
jgi:hypothetical protein